MLNDHSVCSRCSEQSMTWIALPILEVDPRTSGREALGDLDDLHEATDCLEAYETFQPEHFDRGDINRRLHACGQEEGNVRCSQRIGGQHH
jgi:hypothetical protein